MESQLKVVGLTGGIASGKSTVAGFLREAKVPVIDADGIGHLVLDKNGEAFEPVVTAFGSEILSADGTIDRQKLGAKVFNDEGKRAQLEAITHPAIAHLSKRGLEIIAERGEPLAFYEAALLVETNVHEGLDALVVVSCSVATQMARLMTREGFGREAAAARIASQYPLEEKLAVADYVIENDGSLVETRASTLRVLDKLKDRQLGVK
jgi:dephospho-CoA kinase